MSSVWFRFSSLRARISRPARFVLKSFSVRFADDVLLLCSTVICNEREGKENSKQGNSEQRDEQDRLLKSTGKDFYLILPSIEC